MPLATSKIPKFDSKGAAALKAEKRTEAKELLDASQQLPLFKFKGFFFNPHYGRQYALRVDGPRCPAKNNQNELCNTMLDIEGESQLNVKCPACGGTYTLSEPLDRLREAAKKKFDGYLALKKQIITLDTPISAVKAESEADGREIKILWSQKDGRNMAVIYFIDKSENHDGTKTQMFIDMDRQEVRHDATDLKPGNTLSRVVATFKETTHDIQYSKNTSK